MTQLVNSRIVEQELFFSLLDKNLYLEVKIKAVLRAMLKRVVLMHLLVQFFANCLAKFQ